MTRHRSIALYAAGTLLLLSLVPAPASSHRAGHRPTAAAPNIVFILVDDQRWDGLWSMPQLNADLVDHGVTFTNSFVSDPLCCPSRSSILTGTYSHTNHVYNNSPPGGGFEKFDDHTTIATWLHDAGYRTGLFGKYLNDYATRFASYVPPGWDQWEAFTSAGGEGTYYGFDVSIDGVDTRFDKSVYSTDWLSNEVTSFISNTPSDQPLFLYFAPKAPHIPAIPPVRYKHAFDSLPPWRPPSYNEADVSDKPQYIQSLPLLTAIQKKAEDAFVRNQYDTMLAVDDAVGNIVSTLSATGRLGDTMIVYASDNGLLWGEHRWTYKTVPYEESVRVPLVIRYDPLTSTARTDDHFALNIDYAPTFAELAGITPPIPEDGTSLIPLLSGNPGSWRTDFLLEHYDDGLERPVPTYCGVRSDKWAYYKYGTGEQELYDLTRDPYEQMNLASDPGHAQILSDLHDRMVVLCDPPPPGFTP